MIRPRELWDKVFTDNMTYKMVAFFIAFILWVMILGRRDFVMTYELPIQYLLPSQSHFFKKPVEEVKVRISGTRHALKRLSRDIDERAVVINLANEEPGRVKKEITSKMIDLPLGTRLLWVSPKFFTAIIVGKTDKSK